jgi:Tfp pilus assembly protein FimV
MGRLGVVAAPGGRSWRVYAGPAAALLAATIAILFVRGGLGGGHHAAPPAAPTRAVSHKAMKPPHVRKLYVVHAGDTIEAISARTGIPQARLLALNPKVTPTALFIGQKLRLR